MNRIKTLSNNGVKDYADRNKELIKERCKVYREKNKDKIRECKSEKHLCSLCGINYTNGHKARHEKSQKHQAALS